MAVCLINVSFSVQIANFVRKKNVLGSLGSFVFSVILCIFSSTKVSVVDDDCVCPFFLACFNVCLALDHGTRKWL